MTPGVDQPETPRQVRLGRSLLFAGALLLPPALVALTHWTGGDDWRVFNSVRAVPVAGPVVSFLHRAVQEVYFPSFWRVGGINPSLTLLVLYLVFVAIYLVRRRWVAAAVLLIVPLVCTWILTALLLGD